MPVSRTMLLALPIVLVLAVITGCAGQNPREKSGNWQNQPVEIVYPRSVGSFLLARNSNDDDPIIGHSLSYASSDYDDLIITVYAYFAGLFPTIQAAIHTEARQIPLELEAAEQARLYMLGEMLSAQEIQLAAGDQTWAGFRHFFEVKNTAGAEILSIADIFYMAPYFVKVRASFPGIGNLSYQDQLLSFEQQLMTELAVSERIRCDKVVTVRPSQNGEQWASLGGRLVVMELSDTATAQDADAQTDMEDVLATPLLLALQRKQQRTAGCHKHAG